MKVLLIIFIILALSWANEDPHESIDDLERSSQEISFEDLDKEVEDIIRKVLEDLRKEFKEKGMPELGIDSFDPLEIGNQRFLFDTFFKLDVNFTQKTVGLLDFQLNDMKFKTDGLYFSFTINWPLITSHHDYGLFVSSMGQDIFGNGQIDVSASNFAVSGVGIISIDDNSLVQIEDLYISLSLGAFDYKITGLMNDENISESISEDITNNAQNTLKILEKHLNSRMDEFIDFINKLIVEEELEEEHINLDQFKFNDFGEKELNQLKRMVIDNKDIYSSIFDENELELDEDDI